MADLTVAAVFAPEALHTLAAGALPLRDMGFWILLADWLEMASICPRNWRMG